MTRNNSSAHVNVTFTDRQDYPQWVIATSVNIFSFLFLTWVLWGMTTFGIRKKKFKHIRNLDISKRNGSVVFLSGYVAILTCYFTLIVDVLFYNLAFGNLNVYPCEVAFDTLHVVYQATVFLFLIFYWLRQRVLYQHPVMSMLANKKWVQVLNWTTLGILIVGSTTNIVSFAVPHQSATVGSGCQTLPPENLTLWPIFMGIGEFVIGQIFMIVLFAHPLRQSSVSQNRERVKAIFRRSLILVLITVISNQAPIIIPFAIYLGPTIHGPIIIFEVNLMIITLCMVLSFKAWGDILRPCTITGEKNTPPVPKVAVIFTPANGKTVSDLLAPSPTSPSTSNKAFDIV